MIGGRGKRYDRMTPEEQRAVDERDLRILELLDEGWTYAAIAAEMGVTDPTIARVKRDCTS